MKRILTFIKNWRTYKKAIIGFALAVSTWAVASLSDGHVSLSEWIALAPVFLSGPGVYVATNGNSLPTPTE